MKVVCLKENLKIPIGIAERVLGKNPTLPILGNFLLSTNNGELCISATDLEMGIKCWTPCKIEREGSASISGRLFTNLINNLSDSRITLETKNNTLNIVCGSQKTSIVGLDPEEFPIIPKPKDTQIIVINPQVLREAFLVVSNAAAATDARLELQGMYVVIKKDTIKVAATDSFRLAEQTIQYKTNKEISFIIPTKTSNELTRFLEGKKELEISATKNQALFKTEGVELFSRLIEGSFPDYEQIIPKNTETTTDVKREDFITALKTAGLFSGKANDIKIFVDPKKKEMTIFSSDPDKGEYTSNVTAHTDGVVQKIGFNAKFLIDGLLNIKSENVVFDLNGETSPAVLRGKGAPDYFYLIMPIRSS